MVTEIRVSAMTPPLLVVAVDVPLARSGLT